MSGVLARRHGRRVSTATQHAFDAIRTDRARPPGRMRDVTDLATLSPRVNGRPWARLTACQRDVLAAMAIGARLIRWHALGRFGKRSIRLADARGSRAVRRPTYEALQAAGYVVTEPAACRGVASTEYALTDVGRAALADPQAG
jgi:hypothetical protein